MTLIKATNMPKRGQLPLFQGESYITLCCYLLIDCPTFLCEGIIVFSQKQPKW